MRKLILLLIAAISSSSYAVDKLDLNDKNDFQLVSTIMKISECNSQSALYKFQKENGIPNGDEFIDNFMESEAKKKGKTLVDMANECQEAFLDFAKITSNNK
ncbi:hypothetical protein AB7224_06615 [Providencia rettgeri]